MGRVQAVTPADFYVAIDFGGTKVDIATGRGPLDIINKTRIPTLHNDGAEQTVRRAISVARTLVAETKNDTGGSLIAVGAASPGIVSEDGIDLAPNVPGWGQLRLPAALREGFRLEEVVVRTDVKLAALAERAAGKLKNRDVALYVGCGTGIGMAAIVDGKIVAGANGAAGELGYARGFDLQAPDLEHYAGGRNLARHADMESSAAEVHRSTELSAVRASNAALDALASALSAAALTIDPAVIVFGGGQMDAAEVILSGVGSRIADICPYPPELVLGAFVHDAPLRGALAAAGTLTEARAGVWN